MTPPLRSNSDAPKLIVLGIVLLVLFPFFWLNIYAEYRGMGNSPQEIDLASVTAPAPNRGRWVRIPQLVVDCNNHAREGGRHSHTYFVAYAPESVRPLLIDAGTGSPSCEHLPRTNLSGVLRPLTESRRRYLVRHGLSVAPASDALVLTWGETPKSSRVLLYMLPFVAIIALAMLWTGVRQQRRRVHFTVSVRAHRNHCRTVI
jgi:hypothetical protein